MYFIQTVVTVRDYTKILFIRKYDKTRIHYIFTYYFTHHCVYELFKFRVD